MISLAFLIFSGKLYLTSNFSFNMERMKKEIMLNDYVITHHEINPQTMAILANHKENRRTNSSHILEESREYIVHISPTKVIDNACKFFGSSLKGRLDGTRDISGITHKSPIVIDPTSGMYFFPTFSPVNAKCSWIAHSHVEMIIPKEKNHTKVVFKNGQRIVFDVSYGSMMNQIHRTAQFRYSLEERIKIIRDNYQMIQVQSEFHDETINKHLFD